MASLDWSQCEAVESIPGKRSGAVVFRGTRTPVSAVFENLPDMGVEELMQEFGVTREQIEAALQFAAQSTEAAPSGSWPPERKSGCRRQRGPQVLLPDGARWVEGNRMSSRRTKAKQ